MGDVALVTPVLTGMREQHPGVELLLVTRSVYKTFFSSIEGLQVYSPDLNSRHKGFPGIIKLYRDLKRDGEINYVIDIHDVIRSKILRFFFWITGTPVAVIRKGKDEKRSVIRGRRKSALKHSTERYCDAFREAGFPVTPVNHPSIIPSEEAVLKAEKLIGGRTQINIGIAPYAKHKLKVWPEEYMISLMNRISENYRVKFWLFGGIDEADKLMRLQESFTGSQSIAGLISLGEELALISKLDLMIAMDSSNMHLAALVGTKVLSIWGGTDPLTGFGAWMQPEQHSVKIPFEELDCRPCTIYGKGDCRRGDLACMNWLMPDIVFKRIENLELLGNNYKINN